MTASRRAVPILVALGVALAEAPRATAAACTGGGPTVKSNSYGRVWKTRVRGADHFYGCLWKVGRRVQLDSGIGINPDLSRRSIRRASLQIGSRYVGYGIELQSGDTAVEFGFAQVAVKDLRTGGVKRSIGLSGRPPILANQIYVYVDELVMRYNGSIAWIQRVDYTETSEGVEGQYQVVRRADGRGVATLDSNRANQRALIEQLVVRGSTLTWRHGAQVRRRTLL